MKVKITLLTLILIILDILTYHASLAVGETGSLPTKVSEKTGRAIMIVVDQVSWDEVMKTNLPNIKKLMASGASGLMTTNPSGGSSRNPENTYLTIGSGTKIAADQCGGLGFNLAENYRNSSALDSYISRTGIKPKGKLVHLGIGQIDNVNKSLKYDVTPGAIGTALHLNGYKTAVVGNADLSGDEKDKYRRYAVEIAMDNTGQVDNGDVHLSSIIHDTSFPGGIRTDYKGLLGESKNLLSKSDFLVVETGDTSRIEKQAQFITANRLTSLKRTALKNIDSFIGQLMDNVNLQKDLVMIVVPGPSNEMMNNGDFLTPFIIAGKEIKSGIVWSGTTKRNGLISNTDLAPTILKYFGLPPVANGMGAKKDILLNGQIIESRNSSDSISEITMLRDKTIFMHNARYPFVKTYINASLAILIAGIFAFKLRILPTHIVKPFLLSVTFMPVVMMMADFLYDYSIAMAGIIMLSVVIILTVIFSVLIKIPNLNPFLISTGLTTLILVGDILAGGPLAKTSPLSYDAVAGARFYGIGNEYMGVLIGAVIIFAALLLDLTKGFPRIVVYRAGITILFGMVVFTISAPSYGTNAGGALAAFAGLGTTVLIVYKKTLNLKALLPVAGLAVFLLAVLVLFDATKAVETQSHMGRTIGLIRENGIIEVFNVIVRKSEVNFKLIRGTTWSWFYFLGLSVIVLRNKIFPEEAGLFKRYNPWSEKILPGIIVGSLFALIFNDSGVVAAATLMSFAAPSMVWEFVSLRERTVKRRLEMSTTIME